MAKMPREEAFHKRSYSIYTNMVKRFAEKRNKRGRILRIGRIVPFGLDMFRMWLTGQLGHREDGTVACKWCGKILTAMDLSIDHIDPVDQGGTLDFTNLACVCDECNRLKGGLTVRAFEWLKRAMDMAGYPSSDLTLADAKSLKLRLKGGGVFFKGNKKPEAPKAVAVEDDF
jgi:5-methylcytosine-specific restriction endonuclease McrA